MATQRDFLATDRTVYQVEEDRARPVAYVYKADDAVHIAEVLNEHAERVAKLAEQVRVREEQRRNAAARAHAEAGIPLAPDPWGPAVSVHECTVDETVGAEADQGDTDAEGRSPQEHYERASDLLDDARAFYLGSLQPKATEETRADYVRRVRLLCGLAYGHALLAGVRR